MKLLAIRVALALVVASPAFALAEDAGKATPVSPSVEPKAPDAKAPPATIDPEAKKLEAAAKDAAKKVRDVSYKLKQVGGVMGPDEQISGSVTLSVPEAARDGLPFDRYRIVVNDDKGAPRVEWATDGKSLFKVDHATKKFYSMAVDAKLLSVPPRDVWNFLPPWFTDYAEASPEGLKQTSMTLGKDSEVAGVKCRVLVMNEEMEMPGAPEEAESKKAAPKLLSTSVKHFGQTDLLPRKIEMMMKVTGMEEGPQEMKVVSELADLKVNAGLKDADFALKAPEGFATVAGTVDNMGLKGAGDEMPTLKAEVGKPALPFTLKDSKGNDVSLEGLKGRVVLLDFWATWCGPCTAAMPAIQRLHERFADKPVTIAGVNCWEDKSDAAVKHMEQKKFTYTLLLKGDDLAKQYGISGIPTLILIGKDGNVLHTGVGFGPNEEQHLAELIQKELDKK